MSRSGAYGAAVAHRPFRGSGTGDRGSAHAQTPFPIPQARTPYRLLGGGTGMTALRSPRMSPAPRAAAAPARAYRGLPPEPAYEYYYGTPRPATARRQPRPQVAHPQWLVGTVACVVALLAVGPVMARGQGSGARGQGLTSSLSPERPAVPLRPMTPVSATKPKAAAPVKPAKAAPARPARTYELLGPPSLSVGAIEAVLRGYGSEAAGRGRALYDLGVRYGIDPAYALAFFVHESACGTRGVARLTHSIGNIRWTPGYDNYEGYRSYATWEQGMEDWYKLITDLYINGWGLRTVDAIIPVYAPYGDNNDPPSYIAAVQSLVDEWRGK